ncbi:hypothetical protein [Schleiferia thermophila]|jgi:hypothetical protein|uniref:Uncharacterized protein n=1 Tax=Schleiferia thermophila TaxID=884107 RepID=A0A369A7T2_9FLAO|nr:hypothetical protein [Schleiferia thermophila]KFD38635.1 hypothetical protein AT05_09210 [Schleiferia thermophila str. Yellowstone]RCX05195.1 hypothetical protein DES35_101478 [Schleiferia thermophila]GCD79292.1 hypothetical protein JCM30197_05390 [Schleiferia thermophila]
MSHYTPDFYKIVKEKSLALTDAQYLDTINYLVDEQPILASLLFDLDEEIPEEMQEYLYQAVLMLVSGFKEVGLHVNMVGEDGIKKIINEKNELYKSIINDENPQFDKEKLLSLSDNPSVLRLLFDNFFDRISQHQKYNVYDHLNLMFMLDVLISVIEEHTDLHREI